MDGAIDWTTYDTVVTFSTKKTFELKWIMTMILTQIVERSKNQEITKGFKNKTELNQGRKTNYLSKYPYKRVSNLNTHTHKKKTER